MSRRTAIVVLVLATGCTPAAGTTPHRDRQPLIHTVVARSATARPVLELPGLIAPLRTATLSAASNAPIAEIDVNEGDVVRAGQVLARLDTSELQAQFSGAQRSASEADFRTSQSAYQARLAIVQGVEAWRSAQDGVAQAAAKLRHDRRAYERTKFLASTGDAPQQQLEDARALVATDLADFRTAVAALRQARETVGVNGTVTRGLQRTTVDAARSAAGAAHAQASQLAEQLAKQTIRAPFDGIVVARSCEVGEYPGSRGLFTLQSTSEVYALLSATASQLAHVAPGMPVRVAAPKSGAHADGEIVAVLPQTGPGATTFTVKVRLPNTGGRFASGMVVTGAVQLAAQPGVEVPQAAFVDGTRSHIAVARDGHAHFVTVHEVGSAGANAIVQGIPVGTHVVADGTRIAVDGQPVTGDP